MQINPPFYCSKRACAESQTLTVAVFISIQFIKHAWGFESVNLKKKDLAEFRELLASR